METREAILTGRDPRRGRRGVSMPELLAAALILSFITAATAGLYQVGWAQHRTARGYSDAQTDLRAALRRATRAIRHGYQVEGTSTAGTLAGQSSNASQVIVLVPDPGGSTESDIRFYLSGGTLYGQRQDQAAPGTPLIKGVQTVTFNYFETQLDASSNPVAVAMDSTPQTATEVLVTLTAVRGPATTTVKTYTTLRNAIVGL